ncbi:hypothetical protein ACFLW0_05140 [Chloroflexota bacterium]
MRKSWLLVAGLALIVAVIGLTGCSAPPADVSNFNLIFRYGVTARNELNTFEGTYTKDMIMDPSITVELSLTEEELDRIYQKMVEIDFFDYPDEFSVPIAPGGLVTMVTPYSSYYFEVEYDSTVKELRWEDEIMNQNEEADKLRELIRLIRDIIESKEEYKELPSPTSGYM